MFKEDCPISLLDDDKLNRREFAESLAQAILNHKKENCLTISLMGKWGSGKTSIINMVEDYWNRFDSENIIVHFDPWYFSNRDDLIFQFFDILSNIPEKDFTDKININNLKRLGKSLVNMTSFSLNVGLASVNFDPELNEELSDGETLLSLKESITNEFKQINKKVIIIIDNIDRLSDKEVSESHTQELNRCMLFPVNIPRSLLSLLSQLPIRMQQRVFPSWSCVLSLISGIPAVPSPPVKRTSAQDRRTDLQERLPVPKLWWLQEDQGERMQELFSQFFESA